MFLSRCVDDAMNYERRNKRGRCNLSLPPMSPRPKRHKHHVFCLINGSIAQLGEHLPYKQRVTGSSPVVPTKYGPVVQLVRTLACHARGQGFESPSGRH